MVNTSLSVVLLLGRLHEQPLSNLLRGLLPTGSIVLIWSAVASNLVAISERAFPPFDGIVQRLPDEGGRPPGADASRGLLPLRWAS